MYFFRKLIRFLEDQAKNEPEKFKDFYKEFNYFLKEGICHDYKFQDQIAKLLMFESSASAEGELCTLDEYISRCTPEEKNIYYLVAPNRESAVASPYYETFKKHNKEVLFLYNTIDDFVMSNVKTFSGRTLLSAETSSIDLDKDSSDKDGDDTKDKKKDGEDEKNEDKKEEQTSTKLSDEVSATLCGYLKSSLGPKKVREVRVTNRLSDSPGEKTS